MTCIKKHVKQHVHFKKSLSEQQFFRIIVALGADCMRVVGSLADPTKIIKNKMFRPGLYLKN